MGQHAIDVWERTGGVEGETGRPLGPRGPRVTPGRSAGPGRGEGPGLGEDPGRAEGGPPWRVGCKIDICCGGCIEGAIGNMLIKDARARHTDQY